MHNATAQVDDPVFIGTNGTASEIDEADSATETNDSKETEPEATSLDLHDIPAPDFHSLLAAPLPPPPRATTAPGADSHVTLGSLAFRLFDTIENQIARDPHAATLRVMSSRLDLIEQSPAWS